MITLLDGTTCEGLHKVVIPDAPEDAHHAWRGPLSVSPTSAGPHGIEDSASDTDEQVSKASSPGIPERPASPRLPLRPDAEASDIADMAEYDTLPISEEDVLSDLGLQSRGPCCPRHDMHDHAQECNGVCMPQERSVPYTKKDLVHRGLYRPWFHSRFAKQGWVSLQKQDALNDLRAITGSSRERNKQIAAKEREERERQREEDRMNRTMRKASLKRYEASDESSSSEEDTNVWVGCDSCSKWRRVPRGVEIDMDASFVCTMLPRVSCSVPEEQWDQNDDMGEEDSSDTSERLLQRGVGKRKASGSPVCARERKVKRSVDDLDEGLGQEELSAMASLYQSTGAPSMSRLSAVIRVLALTGKPLHYDLLTRQALVLGLIKFTGSQGTAGESMKAFLNKTIRENKTAAIVNLGKGVYGLKEWITNGQLSLPSSPVSAKAK